MAGLEAFLKQNKAKDGTIKFVASEAFKDDKGNPIEWELRPLKTKEAERIRTACSSVGKGGKVTVDSKKFNRMVAAACTVYPNLNDAQLQDSYGVMGAEELIVEMLDKDGEFQIYTKKCMDISGYDKSESELVDEAKN